MSNATVVANEIINEEPFKQSLAIEMLAEGFLDLTKKLEAAKMAIESMKQLLAWEDINPNDNKDLDEMNKYLKIMNNDKVQTDT